MSVYVKPDGRVFVIHYVDGKQRWKPFGRGDIARQQAIHFDDDLKRRKGKGEITGISVQALCMAYHQHHHVEESTARNDYYKFTVHLLPQLGQYQADALGTKNISKYIETRRESGVRNTTISREIRLLKAVYAWGQRQEPALIVRNPLAGYRIPLRDDSAVLMPPTLAELRRLLDSSEPHLFRAIYLFAYTGIRPGREMTGITWGDIDMDRNQIRVVSARKGGPVVRFVPIITEDGGKQEAVEFGRWLSSWRESDQKEMASKVWTTTVVHYLFRPVKSLKRSWATAKRRAGITRKLRTYDIRHAFATLALEAGADLKAVSEIMGHSRPDTTLRAYQHVSRQQHRDAVGKIPSLGAGPGPMPV